MSDSALDAPRLVVAIPTYRRADALAELLGSVQEQVLETVACGLVDQPRILVVDNDPAQSARAAVDRAQSRALNAGAGRGTEARAGAGDEAGAVAGAAEHAVPVDYLPEAQPGIAAVRNAALAQAQRSGTRLLVFIDDDEVPEADWLAALVQTWREQHADAVAGRVVPTYPEGLDPWLVAGGFFVRRDLPTGTVVPTAPAGNLLLDLRTVGRLGLTFAAETGLTGGEDTAFTAALTRGGGRIVCCAESRVRDAISPERATRRWVLQRAFSHGNGAVLLDMADPGATRRPVRRAKALAGGVARVVAGAARASYGAVRRDLAHQARGARLVARGAGVLSGASGAHYREYARDGRRLVTASGEPWGLRPAVRRSATRATASVASPLTSLIRVDAAPGLVALTFDDGPDPEVTPQILDVLAEQGATATFFVLTGRAQAHPDLVRRMLAEGHEVGLHGLDHRRLTRQDPAEAIEALRRGRDDLESVMGTALRWVRPAYGASSPRLAWGMRRLGLGPVLWSATTWDWKDVSDEQRRGKIAQVRAGDIVLAHDGRADLDDGAVEAADGDAPVVDKPALLAAALTLWAERGLTSTTVSGLVAAGREVREVRLPR